MEVRSNVEKCGTGNASTTLNASEQPSESSVSIGNKEKGQYQSKTTVNEKVSMNTKMTKDESKYKIIKNFHISFRIFFFSKIKEKNF